MGGASAAAPAPVADVSFVCSTDLLDPTWDAFLERTGGHHTQSSCWAALKSRRGWGTLRLTAHRDEIVAGVQVLVKRSHGVSVGYVTRGPALGAGELGGQMLVELKRLARARGIHIMLVQPQLQPDSVVDDLREHGFHPNRIPAAPLATTRVDLRRDEDEILARMKPKTRYNIRLAGRKGVRVRAGRATDIGVLHRLVTATAERNGFPEYPLEYFEDMARTFGLDDRLYLAIAEVDGDPVSAHLSIHFGEVVYYKKGGWTGSHGNFHPNEAMHWAAMRWARERGATSYDLEGIRPHVADMILAGSSPPGETDSLTRFKLGFGGEVTRLPGNHDWAHGRLARGALRVGSQLQAHAPFRALVSRARGTE